MQVDSYLPVERDNDTNDGPFWPPRVMAKASVRVADLIGTQNWIDSDNVADYVECREWEHSRIGVGAHSNGGWLIMDGHHRAVAARIAGVLWIEAEIWEEDDGSDTDDEFDIYPPVAIKPSCNERW